MRENIETTHDHRPHLQHQHQQIQLKEEPESPNTGSFFLRDLMNEEIVSLLQQIDRSPDSVLPALGMRDVSKGRDDETGEENEEDAVEDRTEMSGSGNRVKSRNNRNWATFEQSLWHKTPQVHSSPSSSNSNVASDAAIASSSSSSSLTKRGEGPQLSVVSPLDVLRQQLMYELARRRIKENRDQIRVNEQFLKNLGKRSADPTEEDLMTQSHGDQQLNPQSLSDYLYYDYQPFVTEDSSRTRSSRERDVMQEPQQHSSSESSSSAVRFAREKEEEENDDDVQEEEKEGKEGKVADEAAGGEAVASESPVDEESSLLLSQH